jgi:tripartite ATP-independent transporter DctP family solute receptor
MKKFMALVLVAMLAVSMLTGCGGDNAASGSTTTEANASTEVSEGSEKAVEPVEIKFGHQMTPESTEGQAYEYFKEQVEEKSGGSLIITLYPSEQLGDSKSQIESTLIGTQDVVATGASLFARFDPIFSAFTVPFLFKDNEAFSEMMQGEIGQMQADTLEANGLVLINPARNTMRGPYRVLVSKKPIESVDDIQGLRFRTYENEIYMNAWSTLGANPIIIPWGETYMALMQDTVEAVVSPMSQLYSMKFTEEAKYVTAINEYTSDCIWAMNKAKYDSLTSEQQAILKECSELAGDYLSKLDDETIDASIKKMEEENGAVFSDIDTTPFREKLMSYYEDLEASGKLPQGFVAEAIGE